MRTTAARSTADYSHGCAGSCNVTPVCVVFFPPSHLALPRVLADTLLGKASAKFGLVKVFLPRRRVIVASIRLCTAVHLHRDPSLIRALPQPRPGECLDQSIR